jgi:branched-chain amino acid transport system permease protein
VALGLYWLINRTRIGMLVRAGATHREMVRALGVDVRLLYTGVFGLGALLAGLAGLMAGPIIAVQVGMGEQILILTFVVVVIGGVGSFPGAVLGGLIAGEIISITSMFNPGYAYVMLFAAMTLVLVIRPYGLLGSAGRE